MQCGELKSISIPSSIESIGDYSFYGCSNLINISIKEESQINEIGDYSFCKCINLINISIEKLSNLINIGSYSFSCCVNLISIILPLQLKEISSNLFEGCSKLESITILSNISNIYEFSFLNCYNLECIQYFGTEEPNVNQNAFQGCTILKYIYTNLTYSNETFGSFKVQKRAKISDMCSSDLGSSKRSGLKDGQIACIVIFSFIFIVIICIILFFTVFKRNKSIKEEENTP